MLISYFQFWVHLTFLLKGVRSLVVSGGSTWEDRPLTSTIRNICNLRCVNVSVWVQLSKFLRLNYKSLYYCVNYMTVMKQILLGLYSQKLCVGTNLKKKSVLFWIWGNNSVLKYRLVCVDILFPILRCCNRNQHLLQPTV